MSETSKNKFFWLRFASKHPILANIVYICVAGAVLIGLGFLFLNRWTHHGDIDQIPNVASLDYERAMNVLEEQGFQVEISDSVYDARLKPGTVISSWPKAGAVVKPGREVFLTIASFQPRKVSISMPLVNVSSRQAMKYLESVGIKNVRIVNVPSQFADLVLGAKYRGQDIVPGMLLPVNGEVTLEVGTVPTVSEEEIGDYHETNSTDVIRDSWNEPDYNDDEPQSSAYD